MKKVAVLGSTGSIGTQTLDVVRANDDLEVVGLAAGSNVEMLEKQIREFHPRLVAVWKEEAARDLAVRCADPACRQRAQCYFPGTSWREKRADT